MAPLFSRVAVLGTGLIGGSFALAVRRVLGIRIVGWDKPNVLERALQLGVVDDVNPELQEAVKGADLIYTRHVQANALVTDACSTKRAICAAAGKCFSEEVVFLGGHPMAGSEVSGIEGADAALFHGAKYALVQRETGAGDGSISSDPISKEMGRVEQVDARIANFMRLIEAIGARPIWIDAAGHDRAAAFVSHLPQLVSIALAGVTREATDQTGLPLTLAGRGLRDALRLAGSPYSVWRDIVLTNTDNLDMALDRLAQAIEHLRAHLRQRELEEEFSAANDVYKLLHNLR